MGRCPQCSAWNTLEEQVVTSPSTKRASLATSSRPTKLNEIPLDQGGELRQRTGISELDTVLGGGLVSGSLVLLGGDPGVGKSTLLLMALDRFARRGLPVLYVTGEESARQVRLRAQRLGVGGDGLSVLAHTDFDHIEAMARESKPVILVVDSVQTVHVPSVGSIAGSPSQVREVAHRAMLFAKGTSTATVLVGHITKSGELAGPKVLEHFVDTVLYFEGDGRSELRVLRAVKNRFGASGELGMFEMGEGGLAEVPDASARLLAERAADAAGTAVLATLEGSRPLLAEVQALVGAPSPATPARTTVGIDRSRVLMLAAVLQKCGFALHDRDIFANAAGGVTLREPGADLALACAIASSLTDVAIPADTVIFGEIGLVGEVRATSHPGTRLREAARHGFRRAIVPMSCADGDHPGLQLKGVRSVRDALGILFDS